MTSFLLIAIFATLALLQAAQLLIEVGRAKREKMAMQKVEKNWEAIQQMQKQPPAPVYEVPPPAYAHRVYAALLKQGGATRLFMAASNTIEEFVNRGQMLLGKEWRAERIDCVDVFKPEKETVYVPAVPTKAERKKIATEDFVHQLEYARDTFAESSIQRKAFEAVISKVKTKYEP